MTQMKPREHAPTAWDYEFAERLRHNLLVVPHAELVEKVLSPDRRPAQFHAALAHVMADRAHLDYAGVFIADAEFLLISRLIAESPGRTYVNKFVPRNLPPVYSVRVRGRSPSGFSYGALVRWMKDFSLLEGIEEYYEEPE